MGKKCIICGKEAKFCIKDTSDYYCEECAVDNFGDISMLLTVQEQAQLLKDAIREKIGDADDEGDGDEQAVHKQATEKENNDDQEE